MINPIAGSLHLSGLNELILNNWLQVPAIARKETWSVNKETKVTLIAGLENALSPVLIGFIIGVAVFS